MKSRCLLLVSACSLAGAPRVNISPELHPESHKTFFDKDYPDDHRGGVGHAFPNELYPRLQGSNKYDEDYVKDENDDSGEWKAQHEYDELRAKLQREKYDLARAEA